VPVALLISAFAPVLIIPLLMIGGLYLCFEGVEKLAHKFLSHADDRTPEQRLGALANPNTDMLAFENDKIKGAIRTDFILSAEIIVIALGTLAGVSFLNQVLVLTIIAVAMTIGVYGLVGAIVKLDDVGFYLLKKPSILAKTFGRGLVATAPKLMKFLSVAGTIAMFLVGGGILAHGTPALHHGVEHLAQMTGFFTSITAALLNGLIGMLAGAMVLAVVMGIGQLKQRVH